MKITAQDEYGLRIILRIARQNENEGLSIPQLSKTEGMSHASVAKLTRILRMAGYINSTKGHVGGYVLAMPANQINVNDVLKSLGGALYDDDFCMKHTGVLNLCTNSIDCSIRSLWKTVQYSIDQILEKVTLKNLIGSEDDVTCALQKI